MSKLEKAIEKEIAKTEAYLRKVNKLLKKVDESDASIKVSYHGKSLQYYRREKNGKQTSEKYIHISNKDEIIGIVKYQYYTRVKKMLEKRNQLLNRTIKGMDKNNIDRAYRLLGKAKQELVEPIDLSDEQYRELWESQEYESKSFEEDTAEIYTDKGERVRSKSEKIIADKLYRNNISYRYEYPLDIPYMGKFYPDFTILDEENRRNIILEHLGLMDNAEYVNNAVSKIHVYASAGYNLGDNLFITMETSGKPLDSRVLDGIIKAIKK